MTYNELKIVHFELEGRPVAFFSSWWRLSEFVAKIKEERPDMMEYYHIQIVTGWRKFWYLYRHPQIKLT